jgi:hypothetical protein
MAEVNKDAWSRLVDEAVDQELGPAGDWLASLPLSASSSPDTWWPSRGGEGTAPGLASEAGEAQPGDTVGTYRLVRLVARGGMGSVWLAERADGALQRRVAIKLPHLAWGAGLAERMRRERDIGARLEHPHIARLYDAGVDHRGHPFLAFEFIDGVAIDLWCSSRQLNARARLKLFLQVAQAVAYAHARLVVHRDLKPSNVLVSADGQVHLLDFGIAKLLHEGPDDASATQRLGAAMTPHYASPEQLRGEPVTVASDVYSLGIMLYELLTGERPHQPERSGLAAWQQVVQLEEPAPASHKVADRALSRTLRGDIDAILAKALRRQPEQRYATVDALADDIQRHLAGEPVRARPDTAAYRLTRLVTRHTAASATVATVALAAVIGTAVIVGQARRASAEAEQALLVKRFVIDAFRASAQVDDVDERSRASSFERLLERNAQLIARANTPRLQAELYGIVAGILLDAQSFEFAAQNARRQITALEHAGAPATERATAHLLLSQALLGDGLSVEAEEQARRAQGLAAPGTPPAARARLQLSAALAATGQLAAAATELDQVDAELFAGGRTALAERARAMALRAEILDARNQAEQAETLLVHAIEMADSVPAQSGRLAIDLRLALARHLILQRRVDAARAVIVPALAAVRSAGGTAAEVALVEAEMGALTLYAGASAAGIEAALATVERSHAAITAAEARATPLQKAWADAYAAEAALARGQLERAQTLATAAGSVLLPLARSPRARLQLLAVLAQVAVRSGPAANADELLRDWLTLAETRFPREIWRARLIEAEHLGNQGRWTKAEGTLDEVDAEASASFSAGEAQARSATERLRALLDRGERSQAAALAESGAPAADAEPRAEALCHAGRTAAGLALLDKADRAMPAGAYPYSLAVAQRLAVRGLCHLAAGNRGQAAAMARLARTTFEAQPATHPAYRRVLQRLDEALGRPAGHRTNSKN